MSEMIAPDEPVYVRNDHLERSEHRLPPVDDGLYRVKGVTPTTVTVKVGDTLKRLLRDRVVKAPRPEAQTKETVLTDKNAAGYETEGRVE